MKWFGILVCVGGAISSVACVMYGDLGEQERILMAGIALVDSFIAGVLLRIE